MDRERETVPPGEPGVSRETGLWLLGLVVLPIVAFLIYFIPWGGGALVRDCEDALKRTLKAPSTYQQIDYQRVGTSIIITYDAANSFGVPLRSSGTCDISGATVVWRE